MDFKVIFLIIGIIFWLVRSLSAGKENQKVSGKPKRKVPRPAPQSNQQKSIDDIFNDFVKEVENAKKKPVQVVKPKPVVSAKAVKKPNLDWQAVETTKIQPKKALLNHENYQGISHRVDEEHQVEKMTLIEESEGQVFEFDVDNIDWRQAIITKEILDRPHR